MDPRDTAALREVFRINTVLWGGIYNFIIPVFKKTPQRYRERFLKAPSAGEIVNGLIDAFEPDFLVETKSGLATGMKFPAERIISMEQLISRGEEGRSIYGIDIRSICAALYHDAFRFVQRHPPKVVIPHPSDKRFELLFAAMFGDFPTNDKLADCAGDYKAALDAKDETIAPIEFTRVFQPQYLFPLRVGRHDLSTRRLGWPVDPVLFYMDELSNFDLIEFWNLRAIGWPIHPLPCSLAEEMKEYCEQFITDVYKPFPPPSNAYQSASFLCSRSCKFEQMQAFVASLKRSSDYAVTIDPRVPRIWEEWGRAADHAEPQLVTHAIKEVDAVVGVDSLHLRTVLPDFLESDDCSGQEHACTNVLESIPGGAAVIPWKNVDLRGLIWRFGDNRIWSGREGIVTTASEYTTSRYLRTPSPMNVFRSFAEGQNFTFSLSSSGRVCEQIIASLGGLQWIRLIANEGILKLLDKLAHGALEIEVSEDDSNKKRRVRTASAPYPTVQEILMRANDNNQGVAANHLNTLIRRNVLKLGMRLRCTECTQKNWYSLEALSSVLKCPHCMQEFSLVVDSPPRDDWAYRVLGPFAVEGFALGSYCVAAALQYLAEEVATASTWVPSFTMSRADVNCEADFGMFLRPTRFSYFRGPLLVFGECKTFGDFEERDFQRARDLARLFPGAMLCFGTLKEALNHSEKKEIAKIARKGRTHLKNGQQSNPVLVLTRVELFGQFKLGGFLESYGAHAPRAKHVFSTREPQELCDFTQQVHLGMEPYHSWLESKRRKRLAKLSKPPV